MEPCVWAPGQAASALSLVLDCTHPMSPSCTPCLLLGPEKLVLSAEKFLRQDSGPQRYNSSEDSVPEPEVALLKA